MNYFFEVINLLLDPYSLICKKYIQFDYFNLALYLFEKFFLVEVYLTIYAIGLDSSVLKFFSLIYYYVLIFISFFFDIFLLNFSDLFEIAWKTVFTTLRLSFVIFDFVSYKMHLNLFYCLSFVRDCFKPIYDLLIDIVELVWIAIYIVWLYIEYFFFFYIISPISNYICTVHLNFLIFFSYIYYADIPFDIIFWNLLDYLFFIYANICYWFFICPIYIIFWICWQIFNIIVSVVYSVFVFFSSLYFNIILTLVQIPVTFFSYIFDYLFSVFPTFEIICSLAWGAIFFCVTFLFDFFIYEHFLLIFSNFSNLLFKFFPKSFIWELTPSLYLLYMGLCYYFTLAIIYTVGLFVNLLDDASDVKPPKQKSFVSLKEFLFS